MMYVLGYVGGNYRIRSHDVKYLLIISFESFPMNSKIDIYNWVLGMITSLFHFINAALNQFEFSKIRVD